MDNVLGVVASILQIMGVDVATLISLVTGVLRLRSCKLERGKLKQRAWELEALARLPTGPRAEEAMKATGLWEQAVLPAVQAANRLVEAYDSSTMFDVVRNGRRMERDMFLVRRRVRNCYDLAVGVHAGVAVISTSIVIRHAGQTRS